LEKEKGRKDFAMRKRENGEERRRRRRTHLRLDDRFAAAAVVRGSRTNVPKAYNGAASSAGTALREIVVLREAGVRCVGLRVTGVYEAPLLGAWSGSPQERNAVAE